MRAVNRFLGLSLWAGGLFLVAHATPITAQLSESGMDARWFPFIGCWEAVGAEEEIGLLCFEPIAENVEVTNYVGGEIMSVEILAADGEPREVSAEECEGWESLVFSEDGRRAFTVTDFFCGDSEVRAGTGLMTFLSATSWADIRALNVEGESVAWVQEYQLASPSTLREYEIEDPVAGRGFMVRSARMAASALITIEDVLEASAVMDDKAVETWVVLQGDDLRVDAQDLMVLADAGVSEDLIDAVVVVSNPQEFMVEVGYDVDRYEIDPYPVHYRGYMSAARYWGPAWGAGRYYGYSPYYGGYGYYDGFHRYGYWGARPGYVTVIPRRNAGGAVYRDGYRRGSNGAGEGVRRRGYGPEVTDPGRASSDGGSGGTTRRAKPRGRTSGEVSPQASRRAPVQPGPRTFGSERAGSQGEATRRIATLRSGSESLATNRGVTRVPISQGTIRSAAPQSYRSPPPVNTRTPLPRVSNPRIPSASTRPAQTPVMSGPGARVPARSSGAVRRPSGSR